MRYYPSVFDMFDDFFNDSYTPAYSKRDVMRTDIHEKDGQYLLEVELPGYIKNLLLHLLIAQVELQGPNPILV